MRRSLSAIALAMVALLGMAEAAHALDVGVCTINLGADGRMRPNVGATILGSRQPGGKAATASVTTAGIGSIPLLQLTCFALSTTSPASFSIAPSGGNTNVTMTSIMRINGGADVPANTAVTVLNDTHNLTIDLTATKSSGVFPHDTYRGTVTLRCE
ncbi:MAG: hypothetical protein AB7S80_10905 [Rhizobiaceae bacterium]